MQEQIDYFRQVIAIYSFIQKKRINKYSIVFFSSLSMILESFDLQIMI